MARIEIMRALCWSESDSEDEVVKLAPVIVPEWDGVSTGCLCEYGKVRRPSTMSWYDWQELLETIPGTPEYIETQEDSYKMVESKKHKRARNKNRELPKKKYLFSMAASGSRMKWKKKF